MVFFKYHCSRCRNGIFIDWAVAIGAKQPGSALDPFTRQLAAAKRTKPFGIHFFNFLMSSEAIFSSGAQHTAKDRAHPGSALRGIGSHTQHKEAGIDFHGIINC